MWRRYTMREKSTGNQHPLLEQYTTTHWAGTISYNNPINCNHCLAFDGAKLYCIKLHQPTQCKKAIREKRLITPRDNWWRFYNQKGSKTPENPGFPGFSYAQNRWYRLSWFERIWRVLTLFLVVNDGGTSVFDPILVNRWGNFCPKSGDAWRVFLLLFSVLKMLPLMWCWTNHKEWTVLAQSDQM